jgi:hypothetical protein
MITDVSYEGQNKLGPEAMAVFAALTGLRRLEPSDALEINERLAKHGFGYIQVKITEAPGLTTMSVEDCSVSGEGL